MEAAELDKKIHQKLTCHASTELIYWLDDFRNLFTTFSILIAECGAKKSFGHGISIFFVDRLYVLVVLVDTINMF